jgi:hypothetical protein
MRWFKGWIKIDNLIPEKTNLHLHTKGSQGFLEAWDAQEWRKAKQGTSL